MNEAEHNEEARQVGQTKLHCQDALLFVLDRAEDACSLSKVTDQRIDGSREDYDFQDAYVVSWGDMEA